MGELIMFLIAIWIASELQTAKEQRARNRRGED